jgi:hypothetical protein
MQINAVKAAPGFKSFTSLNADTNKKELGARLNTNLGAISKQASTSD